MTMTMNPSEFRMLGRYAAAFQICVLALIVAPSIAFVVVFDVSIFSVSMLFFIMSNECPKNHIHLLTTKTQSQTS